MKSATLVESLVQIPKTTPGLRISLSPFISLFFNFFEVVSAFRVVTHMAVQQSKHTSSQDRSFLGCKIQFCQSSFEPHSGDSAPEIRWDAPVLCCLPWEGACPHAFAAVSEEQTVEPGGHLSALERCPLQDTRTR